MGMHPTVKRVYNVVEEKETPVKKVIKKKPVKKVVKKSEKVVEKEVKVEKSE